MGTWHRCAGGTPSRCVTARRRSRCLCRSRVLPPGLEVREPTDANALPMAPRITLKEGIDVVELLRVDRDDR